jgi:hypothetical protein
VRTRLQRRLILLLALLAAAPCAFAQTNTGTVVSGCGSLDANRQLALAVTGNASAGQILVLAISLAPTTASGLRVSDTRGSAYRALTTHRSRTDSTGVLLQAATLSAGLAGGDQIRLTFDTAPSGTEACVIAIGYADLLNESRGLRAAGVASGTGNAPSVATGPALPGVAQALFAGIAFDQSPGSLGAAADVAVVGPICAGSGGLCLALAIATGDSGSATAASLNLSAAQASDWQGAAAVLPRPQVFADGFEQ